MTPPAPPRVSGGRVQGQSQPFRKLRPLHPRFGVELIEAQACALDAEAVEQVRTLLAQHGAILFRGQQLTDEAHEAFSRRIGTGALELSARRISHGRATPYVSQLTNLADGRGRALGFGGNGTDFWHSDQEFRERPATLATLYCRIPAPVGGETSFASTVVANLGLSPDLLDRIRPLWSTRMPAQSHDNVDRIEVAHPLVLRTPCGDRELLYHSENTRRFLGVGEREATTLRATLLDAILAPANLYSHRWQAGDLLLYDNTQLVHRREAFSGERWLQGTKIFGPPDRFAQPAGMRCGTSEEAILATA